MKRKSIMRWKKLTFKSFFVVLVKYEKNHIYRMLRSNEIIYRVLFVIWINEKRKESSTVEISSTKRSIIESIILSTKKQNLKSNLVIIFIFSFQFNLSILDVSFFSIFSTAKINTLNIKSISSIFFDSQRFRTSLRVTSSSRFFELTKLVNYEMHEKRYRFLTCREISIIQKDDEWF
jgi:hypothetical protein